MPPFDPDYPEFSVDPFLLRFPEFRSAGALIPVALQNAANRISTAVYGNKTDDATQLLAAHLLAISPYGRSQRMVADDGSTTYNTELDAIKREVIPRMIVI